MTGSTVVIRLRAYRGEQNETTECFNGLRDEAADLIEKLISERDALRALLRRVLSCGLNEEPHGVGFTPSRQERKAGELARDIDAALGKESKDQRNGY